MDAIIRSFKFMKRVRNLTQDSPSTEIVHALNRVWIQAEENTISTIESQLGLDVNRARKVLELMRSV